MPKTSLEPTRLENVRTRGFNHGMTVAYDRPEEPEAPSAADVEANLHAVYTFFQLASILDVDTDDVHGSTLRYAAALREYVRGYQDGYCHEAQAIAQP